MVSYFHATGHELVIGQVLFAKPKPNRLGISAILEQYRPHDMIPHNNALFMVDNCDTKVISNLGVDWTYCYEVKPIDVVERHNMGWLDELHFRFTSSYSTERSIKNAAMKYWSGAPYPKRRVQRWEFLTQSFIVMGLASYNPYEEKLA